MSEKNQAPVKTVAKIMYALSIHMKYGEVLHVEGLSKEEKDKYFDLARKESGTMLVEDRNSVRHLHSQDIAKISVKAYDEKYSKLYHPFEKMLFSESSLGRRVFSLIIKAFIVLSIVGMLAVFGLAMIDGDIMDVFFNGEVLSATLSKGFDIINKIFGFTVILLILLNLIDLILGLKAHYYINQDGAYPVEFSRLSNALVTIAFIIIFTLAKMMLGFVANMI